MTSMDWLLLVRRIRPKLAAVVVFAFLLLPLHTREAIFWSVTRQEARRVSSTLESAFDRAFSRGLHHRRCVHPGACRH